MANEVTDNAQPYFNFLDAMLRFEDLKVMIGIGPRFRYPKGYRKGKVESAQPRGARGTAQGEKSGKTAPPKLRHKVARIGHVWNHRAGWMTDTWDRLENQFEQKVGQMHQQAIQGTHPVKAARRMGEFYAEHYRNAIQQLGLTYSGKLSESIKVTVTDAVERARRKAAKLKREAQGR